MIDAALVLDELRKCGVTHVVSLPDNTSAGLLELVSVERRMTVVPVTREGEAFAVAAGLWIGGATPVVVIQNTGFLESGDSFRGTVQRMRIPLLCLVTFRGYATLKRLGDGQGGNQDIELMSRADVDSTALVTEPTLRAWGLPYRFLAGNAAMPALSACFEQARRESRPIALLVNTAITNRGHTPAIT